MRNRIPTSRVRSERCEGDLPRLTKMVGTYRGSEPTVFMGENRSVMFLELDSGRQLRIIDCPINERQLVGKRVRLRAYREEGAWVLYHETNHKYPRSVT